MSERILFVDRDGTILEEPHDFQVDSFEKMRFVEGVFARTQSASRSRLETRDGFQSGRVGHGVISH